MPKIRNTHIYRGMRGIKALPVVDETLDETTGTDTPTDGRYGERPDALFCRVEVRQRLACTEMVHGLPNRFITFSQLSIGWPHDAAACSDRDECPG
jgi:hypothetical protein